VDQVEHAERPARRWQVLCVAAVLAVAACGGGGSGDDHAAEDDPAARTTTTVEDAAGTTSGEATTTTGPTPPAPPAAAPGAPGDVGTQLGVDRPFTGEGSEAFCGEMRALETSMRSGAPADLDEAAVTAQMAQLTPPAEIAADWSLMVTVQQQLSTAQDADPLASIDQAQLDAFGAASAVVAAYLGDVCGLELLG
jgi:hypothetical protein